MTTTFLPRSAWTDTAASSNGSWIAHLGIAVHYPAAGSVSLAGLSQEQVAQRLRGWRNYHIGTRGWADIGYNYAIDQAGRVWTLRGMTNTGVHSAHKGYDPDANQKYLGVLFVIGNTEQPTGAAIEAFRALRAQWLARHPGATVVRGHRDLGPTQCPGAALYALVKSGGLVGGPSSPPPVVDPEPQAPTAARLRRGSTGQDVSQLQREMNRVFPAYRFTVSVRRGERLDVDGSYGPQTEAWVAEFQRRAGLPVTGMVESRDAEAMIRHGMRLSGGGTSTGGTSTSAGATLRRGSTGADVLSYQRQMNRVFPAYRSTVKVRRGQRLDEDGSYGPQTEAWTKEFQRRSNLRQTGIVNAETRRELAKHGVNV